MNHLIESNRKELNALFNQHRVSKAYLFGSAVNGQFNEESDIDLLIDFSEEVNPLDRGELWWSLFDQLRNLFNREVDLVVSTSLKNPYFIKQVNDTKELIYG